MNGNERNVFAISVKHTENRWKFGMPCILWGRRTKDGEHRSFCGYTTDPNAAELYSLADWQGKYGDASWIKNNEVVKMSMDFCKKYRKYDTVLVDSHNYFSYCEACGFGGTDNGA